MKKIKVFIYFCIILFFSVIMINGVMAVRKDRIMIENKSKDNIKIHAEKTIKNKEIIKEKTSENNLKSDSNGKEKLILTKENPYIKPKDKVEEVSVPVPTIEETEEEEETSNTLDEIEEESANRLPAIEDTEEPSNISPVIEDIEEPSNISPVIENREESPNMPAADENTEETNSGNEDRINHIIDPISMLEESEEEIPETIVNPSETVQP